MKILDEADKLWFTYRITLQRNVMKYLWRLATNLSNFKFVMKFHSSVSLISWMMRVVNWNSHIHSLWQAWLCSFIEVLNCQVMSEVTAWRNFGSNSRKGSQFSNWRWQVSMCNPEWVGDDPSFLSACAT